MNENKKLMSGIKSKLIAAVCMLLVAVIMVVSSTYAWFTLSTAPEVTGIQTAVGANGALEMVLVSYNEYGEPIHHDGTLPPNASDAVKNTYWGNLVNVEDDSVYGLDAIKLYPSSLNLNDDNKTFSNIVLKTPVYGNDGRVSSVDANTTTASFSTDGFVPSANDGSKLFGNGVRAVGVVSGMTPRQLAYRNALAVASSSISIAINNASKSLNEDGSILANLAIKKATGNDETTYTAAEIASLQGIVEALLGEVIPNIEKAYMNYLLALAAGGSSSEEAYIYVSGLINTTGATLESVLLAISKQTTHSLPNLGTICDKFTENGIDTTGTGWTNKLMASKADVLSAGTILDEAAEKNTILWSDFSAALYKLADVDKMKINGVNATDITKDDNLSDLINAVASGDGLEVTLATGAGVYADVADHCGNYSSSVTIKDVTYNGLTLNKVNATMKTVTTVDSTYLEQFSAAVVAAGTPPQAEAGVMPITEFYGYIVDLAFRTNAAESNLLLQTDARDRIYAENDSSSATYGGGSSMTFKTTTSGFSNDNVKELMGHIKIVFFTPGASTNTILAHAMLDISDATVGNDGVTAPIRLYEEIPVYSIDNNTALAVKADGTIGTVYYKTGETSTYYKEEACTNVYDVSEGEAVYTTLYSKDGTSFYRDSACENSIALPEGVTVTDTNNTEVHIIEDRDSSIITALSQNTISYVSVLVYLDGESIKNEHVAATAESSMDGSMNLQFGSSAPLVPMDYEFPVEDAQG